MKKSYLFALLVAVLLVLTACGTSVGDEGDALSVESVFTGNVTLASQADVRKYAGTTKIDGNLLITGDEVLNLAPLNGLKEVTGEFEIKDLDNQEVLKGFRSLKEVFDFVISGNDSLTIIEGFNNLKTVGRFFYINDNESLVDIDAFGKLEVIGDVEGSFGDFSISVNDNLTGFPKLTRLTTIGRDFDIYGNGALETVDGLDILTTVGGSFRLEENSALASLPDFGELTTVGRDFIISDNEAMETIDGFDNLETVGFGVPNPDRTFLIDSNGALTIISGFNELEKVNGDFSIEDNALLEFIDGFDSLTDVKFFQLVNNGAAPIKIICPSFQKLPAGQKPFCLIGAIIVTP